MAARILLVDDEETLTTSLSFVLSREGFLVRTASDGQMALRLVEEEPPDLVLLDRMLPAMDGIEVCRRLRLRSQVPIIMLTARDSEVEMIEGLELGADDYITKPFSLGVLLTRIRAVLRRTANSPVREPEPLRVGDVELNEIRHQVTVRGAPVDLSPKEYQLLRLLMRRRGHVLSRQCILREVWGDQFMGDEKTLDVHIRWLRGKIERQPGDPRHIVTIRGAGYMFE